MDAQRPRSWEQATTLSDLGHLTADWLEGKLDSHPLQDAPPDPETAEITTALVALNRAGFVTTFSQPAVEVDHAGSGQRAAVAGYAEEGLARAFGSLTLSSDLLVLTYEPMAAGGYHVPITTEEHHPCTWCGLPDGPEEVECFVRACGLTAGLAIVHSWQIVAIDLKWGRGNALWTELLRVIDSGHNDPWNLSPSPHLDLDTDHVR